MTKNFKKITGEVFDQELQFTNTEASKKDVQATEETCSPQKKTSSTSDLLT
jgi:hypothetical protein